MPLAIPIYSGILATTHANEKLLRKGLVGALLPWLERRAVEKGSTTP